MKILNWTTEDDLNRMKRRGWSERRREPRPDEHRILLTLCHPRQTIGEGHDRHQTAVDTNTLRGSAERYELVDSPLALSAEAGSIGLRASASSTEEFRCR